ncbi:hypothetical protein IQ255_07055 [Pleurocapsales cyanobacterium LEGE 10410]|nr:hypothetical protein [Pleurocapsales cyanobacterium LEGE 10410]
MKTSKKLLLKRQGINNKLVPYYSSKKQLPSLMQDRYHNWSCVLDPAIALSHHGVLIAENMGNEIELWVVRELWNIVNNADFYSQRPELITPQSINGQNNAMTAETIWSLREWEKEKQQKDLAKLGLYWLGDSLQESLLPNNKPAEFFGQWESMARALDRRNEQLNRDRDNILSLAFRDTVALLASLKSAFVLTYQLPKNLDRDPFPSIFGVLENWGIPCQMLNRRNPVIAMERQYLRQLIVRAGLSKLLIAGVNLVVFHLVIPSNNTSTNPIQTDSESTNLEQESYFWNNVKGVGYYL